MKEKGKQKNQQDQKKSQTVVQVIKVTLFMKTVLH